MGWYDLFHSSDGPTLYTISNRTSVTYDVSLVAVCILFATLFFAFVIIFPGVRKQRLSTFLTVSLSLFVGLVILVTRLGSAWHVSSTHIVAPYRSFSREKIPGTIGAYIGLMHLNVTLKALPVGNWTARDIDFNEQFQWGAAHDMQNSYHMALKRGLPYPILTVAEYFSLGREGFAWGGQYRAAGYFASIMLWASFASWLLMNLLLVAVPRYGAYTKVVTGVLLVSTNLGYSRLVPNPQLIIIMEGGRLQFHYGWCFWLILVAGILCLFVGTVISVIDLVWPHTFSTIVEVYFDTPYDRHVILEESHDVRYQKRNSRAMDESLGHKILRRLSSKTRDLNGSNVSNGIDNRAYQRNAPNSPWHNTYRQRPLHPPLHRTISEDSTASMQMEMQPIQKMILSRKMPQPIAEQHTVDMNW